MKPRNFPLRKLKRQIAANIRMHGESTGARYIVPEGSEIIRAIRTKKQRTSAAYR